MKPAWDKLMKKYKDSATALVADVDCTADGKDLCETHGVEGFPTIKWGDPSALEDYDGGREYEDLETFAAENLKPMCSPKNLDLCDADKKAEIESFMKMSDADLQAQIEKKEVELKEAETTFEEEVQKLQTRYEELEKAKTEAQKAVKESGLGLMKAVKAAKGSKEEL
jgi:hypothetical protein